MVPDKQRAVYLSDIITNGMYPWVPPSLRPPKDHSPYAPLTVGPPIGRRHVGKISNGVYAIQEGPAPVRYCVSIGTDNKRVHLASVRNIAEAQELRRLGEELKALLKKEYNGRVPASTFRLRWKELRGKHG